MRARASYGSIKVILLLLAIIFVIQTNALLSSRAQSIKAIQSQRSSGDLDLKSDPEGRTAVTKGNKIHTRLVLNSEDDAAKVRASLPQSFEHTGTTKYFIEGYLPIDALDDASELAGVKFLDITYKSFSHVGQVEGEAGPALRANQVTSKYGVTGTGIKFGVVSTSFNLRNATNLADSLNVEIVKESEMSCAEIGGACDEGRAMIEVMYDIAPNASYAFATGEGGEASFANNLIALANVGAKITVDDLSYISEPVFQPGVIEQAIARNLQQGVYHFTSAKNFGKQGYFEKFNSDDTISYSKGSFSAKNVPCHVFPNGKKFVEVTTTQVNDVVIVLQWNQPFASLGGAGARTDLDLVFSERSATADPSLFTVATSDQTGTDPVEAILFTVPSTSKLRVYVGNANSGPRPVFYLNIYSISAAQTVLGFPSFFNGPTAVSHNASPFAFSIGAAKYSNTPPFDVNPPKLESFSSHGGLPVYFDLSQSKMKATVYKKPDFVGPDGIANTFFGRLEDSVWRFYGTSCAAPAVAAVAGLIVQTKPTVSFNKLRTALRTNAFPFKKQKKGKFSTEFGYGFVNGLAAAKFLNE